MRSKKLVIGLLLLLALVFTTGTFAYWASSVSVTDATSTQTVTIGSGNIVTTTVSLGTIAKDNNTLIPSTYADDLTTFSSTTFTFPVSWAANESGISGVTWDLGVTIDGQTGLGTLTATEITNMFTFTVTSGPSTITEGATAVNVVVTVTFANEPATKAIYDQVASGILSFNVTFTATAPVA